MHSLRKRLNHPILLFLLVTILGYGLLLPYTGFYWDDWPFAWIAKFLGPEEFVPAFAPFRPFLGPIFYATTSVIPPVPLYWQVFALAIRFFMAATSWWTFKQVWPDRPRLALTLSLLLLVFPGYSQHWVAFTHINQELIPFLFYILSFGVTFKALRSERPLSYTIIALLLQVCGIFPTEYFFGLEGLRALFLFHFFQGNLFARLRKTTKAWWPYLIVWVLNAAWLYYYYRFGPYNSYDVTATEETTRLYLLPEVLDTLWKVCFYIWGQILVLVSSNVTAPSSLFTFGLIAAVFAFFIFFPRPFEGKGESRDFALALVLLGLIGILLGRLPSLAAGLPLRLQSSYDRFMVSMMVGGSIFLVGLIELLFRNARFRAIVTLAILALGVGQQFFNANIFRRDWQNQSGIYWQLAWRIPALEPHTVLLTHQMPIDYETDLSFTAPLNWMYAPGFTPPNLPYALLYTEKRLGGTTLPSLESDVPIRFPYRTVKFSGSTSQALVIYKPGNGCLRVLDPARGDGEIYSNLPSDLTDAIPLSSPSRIMTNPDRPASPPFWFTEPEHTWCYYFTKAELAYQENDLSRVVFLQERASSLGFSPEDPNEWLIFIEAHALTGDFEKAAQLSTDILEQDVRMRRGVCVIWKRIQSRAASEMQGYVAQFLAGQGCSE